MAASSIFNHVEGIKGVVLPQTWGVDVYRGRQETYVVYFMCILRLVV